MDYKRMWSEKDVRTLRDNYATLGPLGCEKLIGKSARACAVKASRLGITYVQPTEKAPRKKQVRAVSTATVEEVKRLIIDSLTEHGETVGSYLRRRKGLQSVPKATFYRAIDQLVLSCEISKEQYGKNSAGFRFRIMGRSYLEMLYIKDPRESIRAKPSVIHSMDDYETAADQPGGNGLSCFPVMTGIQSGFSTYARMGF